MGERAREMDREDAEDKGERERERESETTTGAKFIVCRRACERTERSSLPGPDVKPIAVSPDAAPGSGLFRS